MAEMDPIIRDALKRSSQMQGNIPQNRQRQNPHRNEKPKQENQVKESFSKSVQKQEKQKQESVMNSLPKQENISQIKTENALDMLLKNKDRSLIFLLVVLLMSEDSDPSLLLALMYLLI